MTLRPFLRGEGPSPGAGAQYVFVFLLSIAIAAIALGAGSALAYVARRKGSTEHRAFTALVLFLGALGASVLAAWLASVAWGILAPAS